jgi:hypothetical protein
MVPHRSGPGIKGTVAKPDGPISGENLCTKDSQGAIFPKAILNVGVGIGVNHRIGVN